MTDEKKQKIKEYGKNIDKICLKKANKKQILHERIQKTKLTIC